MLFGIAKIGAIAVPFDYNWSAEECAAMVKFFEPSAFVLEGRDETRGQPATRERETDRWVSLPCCRA